MVNRNTEIIEQLLIRVKNLENPKDRSMPTENMSFGDVINYFKSDLYSKDKVTRKCWHNYGIYIYAIKNKIVDHPIEIRVKTVQGYDCPWMPNHSELFADDWMVA